MAVQFSAAAVSELKDLLEKEADPKPDLRIHIQHKCGCGSVHFGMGWDEKREQDETEQLDGFRLIYDKETGTYLDDAEVDFQVQGLQRGFVISRPNAGGGCGCSGH